LKYQIPSPQKVFGKVFKYPQINMYLVFYLNTSFSVFDPTLPLAEFEPPGPFVLTAL